MTLQTAAEMTSLDELKVRVNLLCSSCEFLFQVALKEALDQKGSLGSIKAALRSELFIALQ